MNPFKVIKIAFTCIGILLLSIAGVITYYNLSFSNAAKVTKGEVVELRPGSEYGTYAPTVIYLVDGKSYKVYGSMYSSPPMFSVGENVEVLYKEDNHYDARIKSFSSMWGAVLIIGGLGFIFFVVGVSIMIFTYKSNKQYTALKRVGLRVDAKYIKIEKNKAIEINGDYPYRIVSQWLNPKNNKIYIFKSKNLWFDPKEYIKDKNIKVYIKKNNPKKYYMDISFLPELAN